jgi:hypothetical protein
MGQYYKLVNLDKKEYLKPHDFGHGAKLVEFTSAGSGMMAGLAILLASGNGRGGGDLGGDVNMEYVGRWAGDRVVCVGDYDDDDKWVPGSLYSEASEEDNPEWKNISWEVIRCMCNDEWFADKMAKHLQYENVIRIPEWFLPIWSKYQKIS